MIIIIIINASSYQSHRNVFMPASFVYFWLVFAVEIIFIPKKLLTAAAKARCDAALCKLEKREKQMKIRMICWFVWVFRLFWGAESAVVTVRDARASSIASTAIQMEEKCLCFGIYILLRKTQTWKVIFIATRYENKIDEMYNKCGE